MPSRSNSRGRGDLPLKMLTLSLLLGAAPLARVTFAMPMQMADGLPGTGTVSLVVCDPQTFDNCHREDGVTRPRVLHAETPVYPLKAQQLKIEGVSVVRLVIDTHGVPRNVTTAQSIADTITSHPDVAAEMDRNAVMCVKKFRFAPATLDGKPVATEATLKMNFHHTIPK
jgi:TonB family protein